jgi:hypothetical protein
VSISNFKDHLVTRSPDSIQVAKVNTKLKSPLRDLFKKYEEIKKGIIIKRHEKRCVSVIFTLLPKNPTINALNKGKNTRKNKAITLSFY